MTSALTQLLKELLDDTKASRTTIRIDLPEIGLEPSKPLAEAKRPDVSSILNQVRKNLDQSGTLGFLRRERRLLIQDDLLHPDPGAQPPTELIQTYGTYAQMLGPIFHGDKLIAWISVHENTGARHWVEADEKALSRAVERAIALIDAVAPPSKT